MEAGAIDLGTALQLRAWALFDDPRLPEKYDGAGSTGEDQSLFDDIADSLDVLPDTQRTELERYLLRPTDPRSPFSSESSSAAVARMGLAGLNVAADPELQLCTLPWKWHWQDWSPDGSTDKGFRVWACGLRQETVQADLDTVVSVGSRLWPGMTYAEPDGMGLPVPDTGAAQSDGNGKIDVYLVEPQAECRPRGAACVAISGKAVAAAPKNFPEHCTVVGFPDNGCSGYMVLGRERVRTAEFSADFAHEFFHLLQLAHNGRIDLTWYHEASATWAEFFIERTASQSAAYRLFEIYQGENRSLLWYDYATDYQYRAWGWPLFQAVEEGPSNVFETWVAIESAVTKADVDSAIDRQLGFGSEFRNFAVRNAQPAAYVHPSSTGLEAERWQTKEDLGDFPSTPHLVTAHRSALALGVSEHPADIDPLSAQYDEYEVLGERIRQIEIDISELTGAENADLDVLAQIRGSGDHWTRFVGNGGKRKLCRDIDAENVDTVLAIVISNHVVARKGNLPDFSQRVRGKYTIETKDKCDERELRIGGTITWNATATEEAGDPPRTESVTGTANVVIHVVTPYLLLAEREDQSTYSYDYTSNGKDCPSSLEQGTLESQAGVGTTDEWDYSIGTLNPAGPIGEDLHLQIILADYCGSSMGGDVDRSRPYIQGFPDCEPSGDQLYARFDGVENYVIDCDVIAWGVADEYTGTVSGHVSGVLRPLDGPLPTPPY